MNSGTFIIERLFGAGCYFILVIFITMKIEVAENNHNVLKLLNITRFALCLMAFFYIPAQSADLYRWRILTTNWSNMSIQDFKDTYIGTSNTPVGYLMIYLCQKTGIDGLLPALCAFIFYTNVFDIIKISVDKYKPSNKIIALSFLFLMCTGRFLEVISGVRCMVAFSIVAKCMCVEIIKQKSILTNVLWYIVACLIHTATIPLVTIRLLSLVFENKHKLWVRFINISIVIGFVFLSLKYGDMYISDAFNRASGYINNDVYSYGWEYLIVALQLGIIIYTLKQYYSINIKERSEITSHIARIILIFSIIVIVLFRSYSIFHRFIGYCSFISIPLLYDVYKKDNNCSEASISNIKTICYIILFISTIRGNLCGYKFFVLN